MRTEYLIAWLLPLLAGGGLAWLLHGRAPWRGALAASAGAGWVVGVLGAAMLAGCLARADTRHALDLAAPWLAGAGLLCWAAAAVMRWRRSAAAAMAVPAPPPGRGWRLLWWLLLAVVLLRLVLLGDEAALRPVFPWDAWSAWALKPKSWLLLGQADPYVAMLDWLADPTTTARTTATWNYPELLAWIEVWFASGAGGWNEPLVDLAWLGALAALALAAYGYWRGLGLAAPLAMGLVYALVSLPLVDAHVALAGYADLWVGVTLGLAMLAWSRWLVFREPGQWLLAAALAACLPLIKQEGMVWLLLLAVVAALERVPPRWRRTTAGVALLLVAAWFALASLGVPVGLGDPADGHIALPGVPAFDLGWHPVGGSMLASLFTLPNWHLFWYAFPLLLIVRWRRLRGDPAAAMLGLLALLQGVFLFVLFFFTSAGAWAEDYTSANRLILQVVPGLFALAAVLLRPLPDARAVQASTLP
jgi:hypothetical protein